MKPIFISIQATYAHVHLALFKQNTCIARLSKSETRASSQLVLLIDELLASHNFQVADLNFIVIDKGPGAFTSLRVAIATVNGIAFANHTPLIGIDGLDALVHDVAAQVHSKQIPALSYILVLLNAYNNDVYYALAPFNATAQRYEIGLKGCHKIDTVLEQIKKEYAPRDLIGTGNGCAQHYEMMQQILGKDVQIYHHQQATPTAESIGVLGLEKFLSEQTHTYKVEPNYLKSQYFALKRF
jgi:tRNA threonylcarbamoyl adenosine modification protein YeaZ